MEFWTFYIETFGCRVNQSESLSICQAWTNNGGSQVTSPEQADFIVINSCAITARAEYDARNAVNRLQKKSPKAKIILCGCAAQFYQEFKPRQNANWSLPQVILPQAEKHKLMSGPAGIGLNIKTGPETPSKSTMDRARPIIKIQDGCTQKCTYCIVPQTRAITYSRSPAEILSECKAYAMTGHGELVISGINLRQYTHKEADTFWDLLAFLDLKLKQEVGNAVRLRLSSIEPAQLTSRALSVLEKCEIVCPHLHLSLQHASQPVLKRMGRGHYTANSILNFIRQLETIWPVFGLGADIIAGFPGETENDVQILLEFIHEAPVTYAHVFPYSRRQGTAAQDFAHQITQKIKVERARIIRETVGTKNRNFVKKILALPRLTVAFDSVHDGTAAHGVDEYYNSCLATQNMHVTGGLVDVKPVGLQTGKLLVSPMHMAGDPIS